MTDWYTSIQCMYDRPIHINTVCVLWLIDVHQYSPCIMTGWYTSIQSVYYGTLIHAHPQDVALFVQLISDATSMFIWHPIHVTFMFAIDSCWPATLSAERCLPKKCRALLQWAFYIRSLSYICWKSLGIIWHFWQLMWFVFIKSVIWSHLSNL